MLSDPPNCYPMCMSSVDKPGDVLMSLCMEEVLLCIVVISWGYVLYAVRLAALWQLQQKYPNQILT
ncbi:small integral membrane protein 27 isoform X1 [Phyllobates terribilis]|uniref:small integral membrane protein 27 isoform X1 n=1 Tax=Phyllobates terribilis TaxID=111132 RepID=UPI003CCAE350